MFDLIVIVASLVAGSIGALVLLATAAVGPIALLIPVTRLV